MSQRKVVKVYSYIYIYIYIYISRYLLSVLFVLTMAFCDILSD